MVLITDTIIAAALAAGFLGIVHHQLKPLKLHPLANYVIGSIPCILAASFLIYNYTGKSDLALAIWLIWILVGIVISATYAFDALAGQRRLKEAEKRGRWKEIGEGDGEKE